MTGHTSLPWVCHSGSIYQDGPNVYPKGNQDGIPIAHMDREPGNGTKPVERDENAKLLTVAVNCHKRLVRAIELAYEWVDDNHLRSDIRKILTEARYGPV